MRPDFFNTLKNTQGTNDKIALLKQMIDEDIFVAKAFNYALNPYRVYSIRSLPEYTKTNKTDVDFVELFSKIDKLSTMNHSNSSMELVKSILESAGEYDTVFKQIILKNPDCGVNSANFNKALPKNQKDKYEIKGFPCCLVCSSIDTFLKKVDISEGVFSQTKMDGMRFNCIVDGDEISFFGRSGKPISIPSESFRNEFAKLAESFDKRVVFDGELLVKRDGKILDRKTGNGILNKAVRNTIDESEADLICVTIWDIVPLDLFKEQNYESYSSIEHDYEHRFNRLKSAYKSNDFKKIYLVQTKMVYTTEEAYADFHEKVANGEEGVILKSRHSYWQNKRLEDMCKMKEIKDADLKVVSWTEGSGKYAGQLGAILCESSDGLVRVSIGSGFSDEQRKTLKPEDIVGKIVTVEYNMRIADKGRDGVDSLFLPRLVEIRLDKTVANSSAEIP